MRVDRIVSLALVLLVALSGSLPAQAGRILGPECY
jgi:hypothetical protein